jgi:hypothetical protein
MKFILTLVLSILITVAMGTVVKNFQADKKTSLISPLVSGITTSLESTSGEILNHEPTTGWQIFVNNYFKYKIKHPSDIKIVNKLNGDVSLQKSRFINLNITQGVLAENETINTTVEKLIDSKKNELKDNFKLINNISPIALSSSTALTYTSEENKENITYYFVPQKDNKYLMITNLSPDDGSENYLISENIIYSLEYLP